ncbi:77921833-5b40-4221-9f41-e681ebc3de2d [Thermothielavioides terrestris]|uniref:77921833-5b40-4221-9f41-e681ebc3de2d n=1 Tax=Thermothielavioides terrestris TaxID=2587410 RepID=A0A446BJB9_9PEZI|nr:77921833-5b40-4221-9f41-e681ebc3de2d [Thermothielavioides terrestris]
MSMTSLMMRPHFSTKTRGQCSSSTSRSVLIARKTPPMGPETGATFRHFSRFFTSHLPSWQRYCSCQPRESRPVTRVERKSEMSPARMGAVGGAYSNPCPAGLGSLVLTTILFGCSGKTGSPAPELTSVASTAPSTVSFVSESLAISLHSSAETSLSTCPGGTTRSSCPPTRNTGRLRPAQMSNPAIPFEGVPFEYVGSAPHAIRRQTGVLLWQLNMCWSRFVSGSAFCPTKRCTLGLSRPPRLSQALQRSKRKSGMQRAARSRRTCCGVNWPAAGHIPTRPSTCLCSSVVGCRGLASRAAREAPILWPIKTTPWPAATSRWSSMTFSRSSTRASVE